jgi:GTP-binding protein Era
MRFGTVALVGRTNVGKSTFLNVALGVDLAIVSRRPQTTRDTLLGVVNRREAQIASVDTPGLHRPRNDLGRTMNAAAQATRLAPAPATRQPRRQGGSPTR